MFLTEVKKILAAFNRTTNYSRAQPKDQVKNEIKRRNAITKNEGSKIGIIRQ